jgi:hypothetical protein
MFSIIYIVFSYLSWGNLVSALGESNADISIISKSFYFSAITFFTIGYGDFYPTGIFKFLSAVEGFSGVFLDMGTLIIFKEYLGWTPVLAVIINQVLLISYGFSLNKYSNPF